MVGVCGQRHVHRSVNLRPGGQDTQPIPPVEEAFVGAPIWYPARLTAAEVEPDISGDWNAAAPLARAALVQRRIPGDTSSIIQVTPVPIPANRTVPEMQSVGEPLPAGITIGGVAIYIGRSGAVTGSATIRPAMCLRVWDLTGSILRAELLPVGEYGTGTNLVANTTRLIAAPSATAFPPYVTQTGDRLVLETGARNLSAVDFGEFQWSYGTLVGTVINNDYQLHVAAAAAESVNPGSRVAYLEIDGWSA